VSIHLSTARGRAGKAASALILLRADEPPLGVVEDGVDPIESGAEVFSELDTLFPNALGQPDLFLPAELTDIDHEQLLSDRPHADLFDDWVNLVTLLNHEDLHSTSP